MLALDLNYVSNWGPAPFATNVGSVKRKIHHCFQQAKCVFEMTSLPKYVPAFQIAVFGNIASEKRNHRNLCVYGYSMMLHCTRRPWPVRRQANVWINIGLLVTGPVWSDANYNIGAKSLEGKYIIFS